MKQTTSKLPTVVENGEALAVAGLLPCPHCGQLPEPPYTNNVNETYARLTHLEGCRLGMGEIFRQAHWIRAVGSGDG